VKSILIDEGLCQGARECAAIAPEAVGFNDIGVAHATGAVISDETAERITTACPSMAITTEIPNRPSAATSIEE
jgi:ferredoxin